MTGDLYLLNALWFGAGLVLLGILLPRILKVLRFVLLMCLPFGFVAAWQVVGDIRKAVKSMNEKEGDTS